MLLPAGSAVAAGVLVCTVLARRHRGKRRARARSEAAALRDALDVLVGELRVGAHPVTAFDVAAADCYQDVIVPDRGTRASEKSGR